MSPKVCTTPGRRPVTPDGAADHSHP